MDRPTGEAGAFRVLITAGPTWEPVDAVRFVGNRSSGTMGFALVSACVSRGFSVTLLLGPVGRLPALDASVRVERFETSAELGQLLEAHFEQCDLLIMAAAVADYRPASRQPGKRARGERWTLELEPTEDLVAACVSRRDAKRAETHLPGAGAGVVAFALEEAGGLERRAREKLVRKGVDAVVANPLETMQSDGISGVLLWADGSVDRPELRELTKPAFAEWLVGRLVSKKRGSWNAEGGSQK